MVWWPFHVNLKKTWWLASWFNGQFIEHDRVRRNTCRNRKGHHEWYNNYHKQTNHLNHHKVSTSIARIHTTWPNRPVSALVFEHQHDGWLAAPLLQVGLNQLQPQTNGVAAFAQLWRPLLSAYFLMSRSTWSFLLHLKAIITNKDKKFDQGLYSNKVNTIVPSKLKLRSNLHEGNAWNARATALACGWTHLNRDKLKKIVDILMIREYINVGAANNWAI
jgi:hypothetical protein